jgi:hypothetical protein
VRRDDNSSRGELLTGVSERDREAWTWILRPPWPTRDVDKNKHYCKNVTRREKYESSNSDTE